MARVEFRHAYDGMRTADSDITCPEEEGRTKQEFKDECDVNRIVRQYASGAVSMPVDNPGAFGDVSDVGDFLSAQLLIKNAERAFASLKSEIRDRFANDPARYLAFMGDVKNFDEAVKLGLVNVKAPPEPDKVMKVEVVTPAAVK